MWDLFVLVLGTAGVPGTEPITSKHHTGLRALSGFNKQKLMSTFSYLAQQTFFFFLSRYQIQKVAHCG